MRACPRCGEENPDRARFCLQCGEHLGDAGTGRSERKFATALFADLVGSTSLTEREDPEVVQFVVSRAFDRLAEEVHRYEGLLEKFVGDALLAVFGVEGSRVALRTDRLVTSPSAKNVVRLTRDFVVDGDALTYEVSYGGRRSTAWTAPPCGASQEAVAS